MEKLYYDSPYMKEFEAKVVSCIKGKKGYEVVLDRTAFYPEGGGQPADTGVLGGVRVTDVHERDGVIVHSTEGPLPEGDTVTGTIDWERRFAHMQQHSGEHLVSGLIHRHFGYDNVGFHMGENEVTIDFNGLIEWDELMRIEEEANAIIWENREIRAYFPPADELAAMDYRSKKELTGDVRIVRIPGGDTCACCGTHVRLTGEIGLVKFISMIHYKGGVRIAMLSGKKAVADYEKRRGQVHRISTELSAKPDEVAEAVEKLKQENGELSARISALYQELIAERTERMAVSDKNIVLIEQEFDGLRLRQLANRVLEEKKAKIILALSGIKGGFLYVIGSQSEDVRPLAKELNGLLNGRGGGSMQMAQGTYYTERKLLCAILKEKGFSGPEPYTGTGAQSLSSYAL